MQSVSVYEAQELGKPARTRGIKTLLAPKHRHEKASPRKTAPQAPSAPLQSKAVDAVSHGASASGRGKAEGRPELAITRQELGCAPAPLLQLPAGMPSQDTAAHADARCVVTFQPRQLNPQQGSDSAACRGIDVKRGKNYTPALKTGQQQEGVQAGAGGAPVPEQEGCTARSAARQGVAAAADSCLTVTRPMQAMASTLPASPQSAEQEHEAQAILHLESIQPSISLQPVMQQAAPGSDHSLQEPQQQQLLQARLQLPGMAAIAVAVTRGAEEAAVCMRQLFNTFPDRLPSWKTFSRKARLGEHRCDSCVRGISEP